MALVESAIGGVAATIIEQAIKGTGYVNQQIKDAYTGTLAEQKRIAAVNNYVRRYEERHCQVKVMPGLMKEPLPLDEIYTAVKLLNDESIRFFVGVDDLEETYRKKGRRSFGRDDSERRDGMQVANAEQYLMVLGGPGIGKSTFLRKIGLEVLKPRQDASKQIHRDCIPVLIELKEFRDDTINLKQKIAAEFETCGFPEAMAFTDASLAQGKLLVLLDGLDEVPTRNLNAVIKHLEDFVDAHDNNAFVASCRIAAYRSNQGIGFRRFTDVTMAEFDDEQIEQFVSRWFRSSLDLEAGTANKYWELLQKDEHTATKELAQTPLLLTFLCLVYDREQTLPAQRSSLYGKALNILLSEWAAQKRLEQDPIYEGFHPDLEKVLLAEIAHNSFVQDQLFFLKDDLTRRIGEFLADTLDAPKYLDGTAVLTAIEKQQGVLVERATDIYSFSHLTLQEYLTAFHIVEQRLEDALVKQHLTDERWREVFLLVAGLSGNRAIDFLYRLEKQTRIYLESYTKLCNLLYWVTASTEGSKETYSPLATRAAAFAAAVESNSDSNSVLVLVGGIGIAVEKVIFSIGSSARYIATGITSSNISAINSAIVMARAIARDSLITSNETITCILDDRTFAADSMIGSSNESIIDFVFSFDSHRTIDRAIETAIRLAIDINPNHLEIFNSPKFSDISEQLDQFAKAVPDVSSSSETWWNWADSLEAWWLDTLGLEKADITFTEAEAKALQDYFYATELLLRCKKAAIRIPKQAWADLEAHLLTPHRPENASS
ncbi:NACHT domain-containing protein [filamentous cyanobacterium LEGE 07170]|nr:NACHT domain-containing protein [filamentous cyanobacterium LEGE 07170]